MISDKVVVLTWDEQWEALEEAREEGRKEIKHENSDPELREKITQMEDLISLCAGAASGSRMSWPVNMNSRMESGTPCGWRVNRIGELIDRFKQGYYVGRETPAHGGYYKDERS